MKRVDLFSRTTLVRAAAELTLIVVGILIALAIDSALTEREERVLARQSLEAVAEDLRLLRTQMQEFVDYNANLLRAAAAVEAAFAVDGPVARSPELWDDLLRLTGRRTLVLPRAAFDELVGTGNLRLLPDPELRRELVRFHAEAARDQQIVSNNNRVFTDGIAVELIVGEGLALNHPPPLGIGENLQMTESGNARMRAAGIPEGPRFEGRAWTLAPNDPDRIRLRSAALTVATSASAGMAVAEARLADAEQLLVRVESALGR